MHYGYAEIHQICQNSEIQQKDLLEPDLATAKAKHPHFQCFDIIGWEYGSASSLQKTPSQQFPEVYKPIKQKQRSLKITTCQESQIFENLVKTGMPVTMPTVTTYRRYIGFIYITVKISFH